VNGAHDGGPYKVLLRVPFSVPPCLRGYKTLTPSAPLRRIEMRGPRYFGWIAMPNGFGPVGMRLIAVGLSALKTCTWPNGFVA
jgi:hypothetical protein